MPATPFDSLHLHHLFPAGEIGRLFSDSAEIRALMLVEGTLAQAQAAAGLIPEESAKAIHRAGLEIQIDPGSLAQATGQNGVTVPALVAEFRKEMQAPEHAQYLHWGATSQDIQDTALMMRLGRALRLMAEDLDHIVGVLAALADTHAQTPMAARTWGQHATPTSFGAQLAAWGWPLLDALKALPALRRDCLWVSLSGAAGTASELGPDPAALRADLAKRLALQDPGRSWHSDRSPILGIAGWMSRVTMALGKVGEDSITAAQSGIGEMSLGATGSSSTMPQKQNPVGPSAMVALAHHVQGLHSTLQGALIHRQQRDGAAWFTEWLTLPQLVMGTAAALGQARMLVDDLAPVPEAMTQTLNASGGFVLAERISFALTQTLRRPEAQAEVKRLATLARDTGRSLTDVTQEAHPDLPKEVFDVSAALGTAPDEARNFAKASQAFR